MEILFTHSRFYNTNLWLGMAISCLMLVAFYLFFYQKNKFTGSPSNIPRESPPQAMPPAVLRYIWRPGFDPRCLLAGILSAVVKDCYRIKWRKNSFSIYLNKLATFQELSGDERAALSFAGNNYLERLGVGEKRNQFTRRAEGRMEDFLNQHYRKKYLFRKFHLLLIGLGFSFLACFLIVGFLTYVSPVYAFGYFVLVIPFTLASMFGIYYAYKIKNWVAIAMPIMFTTLSIVLIYHFEPGEGPYLLPLLLPFLLINLFFFIKLPSRKPQGAELHVQIEEFRNFLTERVDKEFEFEKSEYYLIPYLVALDVPFGNHSYFNPIFSASTQQVGRLPGSPV